MALSEELRRAELQQSKNISLMEEISSFTTSDISKIQDEDVLRYVAKFSKNPASRKRAVLELVRMESAEVLEYVASTTSSDETRKLSVKGLARLGDTESLKRLATSRDQGLVQLSCAGLYRNLQRIIRELDAESLVLLSKFSKKGRQRKEAEKWLAKLKVVKIIKKFEA